jgi:hypothetical protein
MGQILHFHGTTVKFFYKLFQYYKLALLKTRVSRNQNKSTILPLAGRKHSAFLYLLCQSLELGQCAWYF